MNSIFSSSQKGSDDTARYIRKKIQETEKNMAQLKKSVASYLRTHEKLRGKRLEMALVLKGFSESETPNVKSALQTAAESFVDLEEYRKYMHDRIDAKTTEPLKVYSIICKNLKDEVKVRENIVMKEHKKQLELDKVTIKQQGNLSKITQSQLQLNNAIQELGFANAGLVEKVEKFHQKKAVDVKDILFEMIYSEIQFHSKALETLTVLHHNLTAANFESDIYEIRDKVKTPTPSTPLVKSP